MLAIIPSIGVSNMFEDLLKILNEAGVTTIVVDNSSEGSKAKQYADDAGVLYRHRPGWNIYKTWNLGIRLGALRNEPVLVLNDDIALTVDGIKAMQNAITDDGWALLGFDYSTPVGMGFQNLGIREAHGTIRVGGIGGFAFGVDPRKSGRCHQGFIWYGGDDDIIYHTISLGGKVGIMSGNPVNHATSTTAVTTVSSLPNNWFEHDRQLLLARWGETW